MNSKNNHKNTKKLISIVNNAQGALMVQIIVIAALLGGISVYMMKADKQSVKSVVKLRQDSQVNLYVNEISDILSDPNKCNLTFSGTVKPSSIVNKVTKNSATNPPTFSEASRKFYIVGQGGDAGYGDNRVRFIDFELIKNGTKNFLLIKIENKKTLKGSIGPTSLNKKINMHIQWDLTTIPASVVACRSLSNSNDELWSMGQGSNIFYTGGKIGIETKTPLTNLEVVGDILSTDIVTADEFLYSSDRRLKKNIGRINNPISKALALRGVTFHWKNNNRYDYGFIAQEVQKYYPELVSNDYGRDILTIDYAKIIPILVEAVKEQENELKALNAQVSSLVR